VLGFKGNCRFALFPGIPDKALIFKAWSTAGASYQQSYPQEG
jgi:hypothetical protein